MLVVVIIFILTFALIGGVVYFSSKKNEESQMSDSSWSLEPESVPVPSKKDPQVTEKAKETEPEPAPVPKKPEPIDCVGKWGQWSQCSAGCNRENKDTVGTQKRNWITLRKAENGGKACVYDVNKDGAKECKGTKGYWTGWSGCAREYRAPRQGKCSCVKTRTFVQVSPSSFGCPQKETVKCGNPHFIPRSPQGCLC